MGLLPVDSIKLTLTFYSSIQFCVSALIDQVVVYKSQQQQLESLNYCLVGVSTRT